MPTVTLRQMVDLSLGTPEVGAVNFNVMHALLHAMISKLQIADVKADINEADRDFLSSSKIRARSTLSEADSGKGEDSEDGMSEKSSIPPFRPTPYHKVEIKLEQLAQQVNQLMELPTNSHIFQKAADQFQKARSQGSGETPVNDIWQFLKIDGRVRTNEEGIDRLVSLVNHLMKEMNHLKDVNKELMDKIQDLNINDLMKKIKALEDKLAELNKNFSELPTPEQFAEFVTWPALEDALKGLRTDIGNLKDRGDRIVIEQSIQTETTQPSRPSSSRVSSSRMSTSSGPSDQLLDILERLGKLSEDHDVLVKRVDDIEEQLKNKINKSDIEGLGVPNELLNQIAQLKQELDRLSQMREKQLPRQIPITGMAKPEGESIETSAISLVQATTNEDKVISITGLQKPSIDSVEVVPQTHSIDSVTVVQQKSSIDSITVVQQKPSIDSITMVQQKSSTDSDTVVQHKPSIDSMTIHVKPDSAKNTIIDDTKLVTENTIVTIPDALKPRGDTGQIDKTDELKSTRESFKKATPFVWMPGSESGFDSRSEAESSSDIGETRKIMDSEALSRAQQAILKLQAELEKLHGTTSDLMDENRERIKELENLLAFCKRLQEEKADKEVTQRELDMKADKRLMDNKVNHSLFDSKTSEIDKLIQEILEKLAGYEADWKQNFSKLMSDIDGKLDRLELDPLKEWLEAQLKALNEKIKRIQSTAEWGEDDAAGIRKQLVQRFHCISCDRPVDMVPTGPIPSLPNQSALPPTRSPRPYTTFELDQIRQQAKSYASGRSSVNYERALAEKQLARLKKSDLKAFLVHFKQEIEAAMGRCTQPGCYDGRDFGSPEITDYYATPRPCGGSHTMTYPHKRMTRLTHLSHLFKEEETVIPTVPKEEVEIFGVDGHIYKGRRGNSKIEARLPVGVNNNNVQTPRPTAEAVTVSIKTQKSSSQLKVSSQTSQRNRPTSARASVTPRPDSVKGRTSSRPQSARPTHSSRTTPAPTEPQMDAEVHGETELEIDDNAIEVPLVDLQVQ